MPAKQTLIQFSSLHLLWQFAQRIHCVTMEINTTQKTLICDCTEKDMDLLLLYDGRVVRVIETPSVHQ